MTNCTLCVKTFLRPNIAERALETAINMYPDMLVHVCDDGDTRRLNTEVDQYITLPFDSGVSAGKNALLDSVETEFVMFMDDDTVWDDNTQVHLGVEALKKYEWLDMVGFKARPNRFHGTLDIQDDTLYRRIGACKEIRAGVPLFDFVVNFFVARTANMIRWNEQLKTMDHTEFFWRAHKEMNISHMRRVQARNVGGGSQRYKEHRYGRKEKFAKIQRDLIGVSRFEDIDAYNGWIDDAKEIFA
jgi:glycosyltransferase involved in cell wall biosynthesis